MRFRVHNELSKLKDKVRDFYCKRDAKLNLDEANSLRFRRQNSRDSFWTMFAFTPPPIGGEIVVSFEEQGNDVTVTCTYSPTEYGVWLRFGLPDPEVIELARVCATCS